MASVTVSTHIECSVDHAFAFLADYRNDPLWRSGVTAMSQDPDGPTRPGTTTTERMRFLGRERETRAEIVAVEPPHRVAFRTVSGYFDAAGDRRIDPEGDGVRVTYFVDATLSPLLRPLTPLIRWAFTRGVREDLARLKEHLENDREKRP